MSLTSYRPALRAALFLGASVAAIAPALAGSNSVGGGTVVTTQVDTVVDNTGAGGSFEVKPNTTGPGDTITITGVTLSSNEAHGAVDLGLALPAGTGPYSVIAHGDNLGNTNAGIGGGLFAAASGGNLSFDTTGGAANIFTSNNNAGVSLQEIASATNSNINVTLGADTLGGATSAGGMTVQNNTNGAINFDAAGATLSGTLVGLQIVGQSGAINIGANGGLANTKFSTTGIDGMFVSSDGGAVSITLASTSSITGPTAIFAAGAPATVTIDASGTITGTSVTPVAISSMAGSSFITLEGTSVTTGLIKTGTFNDSLNIKAGANIANATFDGGTGTNLLTLSGSSGTGTFDASAFSNFTSIAKTGTSTWNLVKSGAAGASALPITISGGTANINGVYTSAVTVNSTGILGGTGKTGAVTVASGGTLAPGAGAPGTLTINGALNMAAGAVYGESISPSATGLTQVNGAATINGTVAANVTTGSPFAKYTIIDATGGVTGTFTSVAVVNTAYRGALSYDANNVYLTLSANALTPLLNGTGTINQNSVAGGIDAAVFGGASLPAGFTPLYNLSGAVLGSVLNQLDGEIGPDAAQSALEALEPFLNLMVQTGQLDGGANGTASNLPDDIKPAQLAVGEMRAWGSAYGGEARFAAQQVPGSQHLSTGTVGGAMGIETRLNDTLLIGASAALGSENFSLAGGQSSGVSTDIFLGLYGRQELMGDRAYVSGALAYGWHNVNTLRTVTVSGVDVLKGHFIAGDFGGRIEGGYNFRLDGGSVLTPYAAFAGQQFSAPAYREGALSGSNNFALAFGSQNSGIVHSELGARLAHGFSVMGDTLSLEGHAAWAHQIQDDALSNASFQNLTGSSFIVAGAVLPQDSGIVGGGLDVKSPSGIDGGLRVDGQFGQGFSAVAGTMHIEISW